jgi:hypothetical protein
MREAATGAALLCVPLGAKGGHPRRLFSISYYLPVHCHGRGRGFEARRSATFKMTYGECGEDNQGTERALREF